MDLTWRSSWNKVAAWGALALLALLVLPLLVRARETARKLQCEDHLRLLARGCTDFATNRRNYLPSNRRVPYTGWNAQLLPFIEEGELSARYDASRNWWDGANSENQVLAATRLSKLLCPSAPNGDRVLALQDPEGNAFQAAPTDYVGSAGAYLHNNVIDQLYRGAMASPGRKYGGSNVLAGQAVRLDEIVDGLSNSLLLVEMADKPNQWQAGKLHINRTQDRSPRPIVEGFGFGQWIAPNWNHLRSFGFDGTTAFGACSVNCSNEGSLYGFHDGFANVALADGSVRPLRSGLDEETMVALVSIADGELVHPADYLPR
ncbi:DUF1559 family PulG-like putative transporter [Aureliella helgolandensis]|uniref:DUF1559 domain-containing protein n=1 Tax=Aureliella helgolandensis TaxID=2527968 RepID=A0A518GHE7_9BACT|nr:DUF1559 domain-containing protein [Aureliella helgolandensis]QDV27988.1 hypothetical protein Q31a_63810 [Aureliella helgolandensis]